MSIRYVDRASHDVGTVEGSEQPAERRRAIGAIWADRRLGLLVATTLGAVLGLASAWLTPRGPISTGEALWTMGAGAAVGIVAGILVGRRWAMLAVPASFLVVFELLRLDLAGPTVDAINLGSLYGVIAFVLGRVMHGILLFGPMAVGVYVGVALSVKMRNEAARVAGAVGWTITALGVVVLIALGLSIARPASTAPILGSDGASPTGSVAELVTVTIGGHEQVIMIRGRDVDNPVLLYLAGGPGGTDIGAMRRDVGLEQHFVVATWDQRGAGKSYGALDPTETFTLGQMVSDTHEVTEYLRERFDQDKIFLVGQSWGSTLGALAVDEQPELYHAFVGVGQMVSQRRTDIMFWEDTLAWADITGRDNLAETLRRNGPPPYENVNDYAPVVSYEHEWNAYPGFDGSNEMPSILFVPEYSLMDRINAFRGFLDTAATLYPQLQGIDFRADLPRLEVPYYMILGEHEARGRAVPANEWFGQLEAPAKESSVFAGSGHRAHFDRPGMFTDVMIGVLAYTETTERSGES